MSKAAKKPTTDSIAALKAEFNALWPISPRAWSAFEAIVSFRRLKSRDVFIREGDASTKGGYVIKGLLRATYIKNGGVEYTQSFFPEGRICAAYPAFLRGQPVTATFEALEDSEIIEIPLKAFRDLFTEYTEWSHIGRLLIEHEYLAHVDRVEDLLTGDANARFSAFKKKHEKLLPRLKNIHLASYLGIKPESLSRLRSKGRSG